MKPRCQAYCPTPQRDMGMAWTCADNVSKSYDFLDTLSEHVHGVDRFQTRLRVQLARFRFSDGRLVQSTKPEDLSAEAFLASIALAAEVAKAEAIHANLRGLGYGG